TDPALSGGHAAKSQLVGDAGGILVAEEFDVTPKRNSRNLPPRAVAIVEADKLFAKPDRKGEHANATPARHQEMAKFVKEHHNRQHEQKRDEIAQQAPAGGAKVRQEVEAHARCPRPIGCWLCIPLARLIRMPLRQFLARALVPTIWNRGQC